MSNHVPSFWSAVAYSFCSMVNNPYICCFPAPYILKSYALVGSLKIFFISGGERLFLILKHFQLQAFWMFLWCMVIICLEKVRFFSSYTFYRIKKIGWNLDRLQILVGWNFSHLQNILVTLTDFFSTDNFSVIFISGYFKQKFVYFYLARVVCCVCVCACVCVCVWGGGGGVFGKDLRAVLYTLDQDKQTKWHLKMFHKILPGLPPSPTIYKDPPSVRAPVPYQ